MATWGDEPPARHPGPAIGVAILVLQNASDDPHLANYVEQVISDAGS